MRAHIFIETILMTFAAAICMAVATPVFAQEVEFADSVLVEEVDTLNPDPEWYVAPFTRDSVRAGKRALVAAAACTIDSVQTFNVDSELESVSIYEYGDTTRTMTWTINPDGSRFGTGRNESGTNGDVTFSASYEWDFTTNDWKGISKEEHTFTGSKETLRTLYDWVNGAWSAHTQYTWIYENGREVEYTTYIRNAAGTLVPSAQRIREYNAGKMTLEIQYTAHNGSAWSAGTKRVYEYEGSNKTLDESYSLSNGAWVGSSREVWTYTSGKKTYYEKDTWSNGAWVGSSKEIWEFNGPSSKQTLHEKYGWSAGAWAITLQENSGYDAAGNNTLVENYSYTNGVQKGTKKITYVYNDANKQTDNITYTWTNNAWVESMWTVTGYDGAGNKNESCVYKWTNGTWAGYGIRTLTTYNSSKKATEVITQTWSKDAVAWVNSTRKTTEYSGTKTTQEATYVWQNDAWAGTSRSDWHYNTKGQNDTIKTYNYVGTEWIYSDRTVNTYNASGTNIMTHNAHWNDESAKWEMTSMTRVDILDHTVGGVRQTLNASWYCDADSVWIGVQKDTVAYNASGNVIFNARYVSWANEDWVPSYKIEYEYDEADRKIFEQRFDWNGNEWKGNYRNEYGFDEQGRQYMTARYVNWNSTTGTWIGSTKTEQTFDENGRVAVSISSFWGTDAWRPAFRYVYTYDTSGREIEQVTENYANGEWSYLRKSTKEYKDNVLVKDNNYVWLSNEWVFNSRNEVYYDDDAQAKLRREVIGSWDSNTGEMLSFIDNHYFYACDPHLYTIRFCNENGAVLETKQVMNGTLPEYDGVVPTKEPTAEFTYTFNGWDKTIAEASGDETYKAVFTPTKRTYTIIWQDENGSEIDRQTLEYGAMPAHDVPTKENTAEFTYTFAGWGKEIVAVAGDETYQAVFTTTKNSYTITWLNADGSEIDHQTLEYGATPTHADPTKEPTAEYTYVFAGWDNTPVTVTGAATYRATFTSTKRTYTITWQDADGSTMDQTTVEYGATPTHADPTKESTAEYTYTFSGWDKTIAAVTGDATYKATFNATKNSYTITWLNEDGSLIEQETLEYGATPTHTDPTKEATAEFTYTFAGWNKEITAVAGNETYTATFNTTKNSYTITWLNEDGSEIDHQTLEYGAMPTHDVPTKEATAEYTYVFAGWGKEITSVTGNETYTATFTATKRQYTITWLSDDGATIAQDNIAYGLTPAHADIDKESTPQYTFTFRGWSPEPAAVTGDAVYTAVFDSVINTYTVTFYFDDGETVLDRQTIPYGETPSTDMTPAKTGEEHYYYHFAGWSPEVTAVTGDVAYTAVFTRLPKQYEITFRNYNNRVLLSTSVAYGTMPTYTGDTPTRARTAQYTYIFAGWSPELTEVAGDATYTAVYESVLNQYTVLFLNEDGTELDRQTVDYGSTPTYQGETPTKESDEQYRYTFAGWTPRIVAVTKDATYTATYTRHDIHEGIDNIPDGWDDARKVMIDGTLYIRRGSHLYTADGVLVE